MDVYSIDVLYILSCIIFGYWAFIVMLHFVAILYGKVHLHKKVEMAPTGTALPGVSIAKPICAASSDPNLKGNLETYFQLNYPQYELFFCIEDSEDAHLIKIVDDLMVQYPDVNAHMFIGAKDVVTNPKISNILQAYDKAKYPLFWISDARIITKPDTLIDMVNHMTEKVGLVHQVPIACDGDASFSRQVEQLWFGGAHSRVYMAANFFGFNVMTGMSCMIRKVLLDEEGGLQKMGRYLGEDFFLAQLVINKGYKITLSSQPAMQNCGLSSIQFYMGRMMRWMYVRQTEKPILLILEPLYEHIVLGPLTSLAVYYLFNIAPYIFLPLHFISFIIGDYILLTVMQNKKPVYSIFSYVKAWMFRELIPLYTMPRAARTKTIVWAGKRFLAHYGGVTERIYDEDLARRSRASVTSGNKRTEVSSTRLWAAYISVCCRQMVDIMVYKK